MRTRRYSGPIGSGYLGKPKPVVTVQDDRFDVSASATSPEFPGDGGPSERRNAQLLRVAYEEARPAATS
jgi:hypothetical protein